MNRRLAFPGQGLVGCSHPTVRVAPIGHIDTVKPHCARKISVLKYPFSVICRPLVMDVAVHDGIYMALLNGRLERRQIDLMQASLVDD